MTVVSHSKPLRSSAIPIKRPAPAGVKSRPSGKNTVKETGAEIAPPWIQKAIFTQARIIAWEGTAGPIQALSVYPATGSFLDAVLLIRTGNRISWEESIHPLDKEKVRRHFAGIKKFPSSIEYRLVAKTGGLAWVRHSITEIVRKGRGTLLRGFVCDIQTEKELELESLRVSEREQNRIGQDLHDDLCQVLAGISCLMHVAESRLASKVPEEVAGLNEINQQVIDAMHRTRALTHGLFPGKIQIADVRGALLELVAQVRARFQVEVKTVFVGRFPHHSSNQIIQIYRLAQEAISNAIKHGHATCIEIQLKAKPNTMLLSIIDNGSGLGKSTSAEKGVGLHIMQYRANTLGGELDIRNAPDQGVVVSMQYPFQT
jgi:signal transduction histidine kinase